MKYIRTKGGHIVDTSIYKKVVERTFNGKVVAIDLNHWGQDNDKCPTWIEAKDIVKQSDTIEELICDDDILYIYDLYPDAVLVVEGNIKPFGYPEAIKLKEWLNHYYKPKFDLFIKDSQGNYIKRAKMNDKGELELI